MASLSEHRDHNSPRISGRGERNDLSNPPIGRADAGSSGDRDEMLKSTSNHVRTLFNGDLGGAAGEENSATIGSPVNAETSLPTGDGFGGANWRRVGKFGLAFGVLIAIGLAPVMRLMAAESAQAVVNARVVTIRAPIEGEVWWNDGVRAGSQINLGDVAFVVRNPRADRTALDNLRRELRRLSAGRQTLDGKIKSAGDERNSLLAANRVHRLARLRQFQQRRQRMLAQVFAAKATEANAVSSLERTVWLAEKGLATHERLEDKRRDRDVARNMVRLHQHQLQEIQVEFTAALGGIRLTDDHNAHTSMKARAEELHYEIRAWKIQLADQDQLIAKLKEDIDKEAERFAKRQQMSVPTPIGGQVWEVLASSGELVEKGQPLVSVMDCNSSLISVSVNEATYNGLHIGENASFRSNSDLVEYRGHIVKMTGLAAPRSNFAIAPSDLRNEPFQLAIYSPELVKQKKCSVGQTGIVRFHADSTVSVMSRIRHWLSYWVGMS